MLGLSVVLLAGTGDALAKDPPSKSDQLSAVAQYREMLPAADGPIVLGAEKKPTQQALPPAAAEVVRTEGGEDAPTLERVATSSLYGAPQKALPALPAPPRVSADKAAPNPVPVPDAKPTRPSGAVVVAAGGIVSEAGSGRLGFLAALLAAITFGCVIGAFARRRAPAR